MRFRSLHLQNFKGFVDETIVLDRPLTVLIGANGSGKTTVLEAMSLLVSDFYRDLLPELAGERLGVDPETDDIRNSCTSALVQAEVDVSGSIHPLPFLIVKAETGQTKKTREVTEASVLHAALCESVRAHKHRPVFLWYPPIVMLKDFRVTKPAAPTSGRDSNSILTEVLGVPERPQAEADQLVQISSLIDDEKYSDAQKAINTLAKKLTENDGEIVRLRTMLHFLEADA